MAIGTSWAAGTWPDNTWEETPPAWEDAGEGPQVGGGMRQMLLGIGCWLLILIQVSGMPLLGLDYSNLGIETRTHSEWQQRKRTTHKSKLQQEQPLELMS